MGGYLFIGLTLAFHVFPCLFLGYSLVSWTLLFFNAAFIFLIFPLKGSLLHKSSFATMTYLTGFGWEYFLACLATNTFRYLGGWTGTVFFVVNPFLELFWMVATWAFGLSILASKETEQKTGRTTWF